MDIYTLYMKIVQVLIPNAYIIIGCFHLVKVLNKELNKFFIGVTNALSNTDYKL